MTPIEEVLEQFRQFVQQQLGAGDANASLDELFDHWRHQHPSNA